MPVHTELADGILSVVVRGEYTSAELRQTGRDALERERVPTPARILLDISGASSLSERSMADLRGTATYFAGLRPRIQRVAILAPDDLAFGLMRMASVFSDAEGLDAEAFRSEDEARAWLAAARPMEMARPTAESVHPASGGGPGQ